MHIGLSCYLLQAILIGVYHQDNNIYECLIDTLSSSINIVEQIRSGAIDRFCILNDAIPFVLVVPSPIVAYKRPVGISFGTTSSYPRTIRCVLSNHTKFPTTILNPIPLRWFSTLRKLLTLLVLVSTLSILSIALSCARRLLVLQLKLVLYILYRLLSSFSSFSGGDSCLHTFPYNERT